jgi:hypothetical protein
MRKSINPTEAGMAFRDRTPPRSVARLKSPAVGEAARIVEVEPSRRERGDGLLLDGRCRWDACEMTEVAPHTELYQGDDPVGFVLARNERRRQMSYIERLKTANKLAGLPRGGDRGNQYTSGKVEYSTLPKQKPNPTSAPGEKIKS